MIFYLVYELPMKPICEMCGREMNIVRVNKRMRRAECVCSHAFAIIPMKAYEIDNELAERNAIKAKQFSEQVRQGEI